MQVHYEPGGLIQDRKDLRSAWNVHLPQLGDLWVGRVESYWVRGRRGGTRWRSLDHWYHDYKEGYTSRETAVAELLAGCPRTVALVRQYTERAQVAAGGPAG